MGIDFDPTTRLIAALTEIATQLQALRVSTLQQRQQHHDELMRGLGLRDRDDDRGPMLNPPECGASCGRLRGFPCERCNEPSPELSAEDLARARGEVQCCISCPHTSPANPFNSKCAHCTRCKMHNSLKPAYEKPGQCCGMCPHPGVSVGGCRNKDRTFPCRRCAAEGR